MMDVTPGSADKAAWWLSRFIDGSTMLESGRRLRSSLFSSQPHVLHVFHHDIFRHVLCENVRRVVRAGYLSESKVTLLQAVLHP